MNRTVLLFAAISVLTSVRYGYTSSEGKIAFVSDRNGNKDIYVMNADGSSAVNVSNHPAVDWFPAWSPGQTSPRQ